MKKNPDINISIRYKILGAFVLSSACPWILYFLGLPIFSSALIGLALSLILGWYSSFRILTTISGLRSMAKKLIPTGLKKGRPFNDELTNLYYAFDDFMVKIDDNQKASAPQQKIDFDLNIRHVFKAEIGTGDSVTGYAAILSNRLLCDFEQVTQHEGAEANQIFLETLTGVKAELNDFIAAPEIDNQTKGIIEFQILFLDDVSFIDGTKHYLKQGLSLHEALNTIFAMLTGQLEQSANPYIKMRVADLHDLKQRLFQFISRGQYNQNQYSEFSDKIVLCEQIYPSEILSLKKAGVKGIISMSGTAASHAEILMESFGIPSLSSLEDLPIHLLEGKPVFVDTINKQLIVNYSKEDSNLLLEQTKIPEIIYKQNITLKSGEPIWVGATINNPYLEATKASELGADGIGLFRTETLFMGSQKLPSEQELFLEYQHLMHAFSNKPINLRLLDLGSDKLAGFQESALKEENPCMGNRSMRLLIQRPDIFRTQLRAVLKACHEDTSIILPMISGWTELMEVSRISDQIVEELKEEGIQKNIKLGLMIEVPALVEKFDTLVDHFDVFNIGSNDLTQYTLAVDRNNREVATYFRYTHPAVLSMIHKVAKIAINKKKKLILCGEMASRIDLLPLVVGLGITHFSVPYKKMNQLKAVLTQLDKSKCQDLAQKCLNQKTPQDIENLILNFTK